MQIMGGLGHNKMHHKGKRVQTISTMLTKTRSESEYRFCHQNSPNLARMVQWLG